MSANEKKMPGTGLEDIGVPGQMFLRDALTSCTDPLKAIEEFQLENGILLPSLRQMLPLLDLHGVRRLDFHTSVMEEIRERLIQHINDIGQKEGRERDKKLKELLSKSFPLVKVKPLRPVVMAILRNTTHIDDKYLRVLVSRPVVMAILRNTTHIDDKYLRVLVRDRDLYNDTDTEVKRQIWKDNQSLFGDEVSPLLSQYIKEKENVLFDHNNLTNLFFTPSPKLRRQGDVVQKLAHMIGNSVKLYDMVLQFLRTLFLRTRNVHYCTLRAELLMALHDLEVQDIISVDPCHKFTWCLDACIREKNVDIKRSRELQGFLDSIKRGQEQVLGDLSMTLCDPYAINFLATSAMKILQHLINNEGLPRENTILILLLRMLALGLSAWVMIDSQEFKEPKLDSQVVTKFLPALMSLIVDDQVRSLNSKLPPDERESAITIIEHSGPPPDACQAYVQESSVASIIAMYYTLQTAKQRDRIGLMRVLGTLATCDSDRAFEDPFLHFLISLLIHMGDEFSTEDFCTVIFDEFFYAGISRENVVRHMLKLLWYVYPKLSSTRLHAIMKVLQPNAQHNDAVHSLYKQLTEKIGSEQEPPAIPENLDYLESPLMSVPTPAPIS
ncbi:negative elongation factor B-like isoform X1 [Macrosteles quadrilineatus]|uniref:negative elongation factor B-like isoform X1 n=1 Tax=Macrosteles quadrilineatus TaxID=74068 RepID=UPI0023E2DC7D|nr:negative elongation factor B-like isoform X1 [Macrosteles quadrilineatus]